MLRFRQLLTVPLRRIHAEATSNINKSNTRPKLNQKSILSLTPSAVSRLKEITAQDQSKILKIGIKKKGCSGNAYTLEYVTEKGKFDELVEQDGVKVIVDSKALFSLIGSEMDFVQDTLSNQFVFNNPNVKEMCGCGQSFMT